MSTTISTDSHHYVAPFVASMDASGAATFAYVQQETVSIAGIHYTFDAQLSEADSVKLLNAFVVSGKGANLTVSVSNAADLEAVLASVINGADEATGNGKTATTQLEFDLHAGLVAAIGSDTLINTVEEVDVGAVDVTILSAAGATAMKEGLTPERCNLIYTQIPASELNLYMDASGEESLTSALPLKKGDKLTFVFDVILSDVAPVRSQINTGVAAGTDGASNVDNNYTSLLHFTLGSKRIAFNIQMAAGSGAFTVGENGLKA